MSRLDRLGSAKEIAQIGAVIGREFPYRLLSRVAQRREDILKEEIQRLLGSGLLEPRRSASVATYAFRHALIRDAAYSSLLKAERKALHARIVEVLTTEFPEIVETQPEMAAYHLQMAGDVGGAVQALDRRGAAVRSPVRFRRSDRSASGGLGSARDAGQRARAACSSSFACTWRWAASMPSNAGSPRPNAAGPTLMHWRCADGWATRGTCLPRLPGWDRSRSRAGTSRNRTRWRKSVSRRRRDRPRPRRLSWATC